MEVTAGKLIAEEFNRMRNQWGATLQLQIGERRKLAKSIKTCASKFGSADCALAFSIEACNLESPILIISCSILVDNAAHAPIVTCWGVSHESVRSRDVVHLSTAAL
jgi:hypothetical protein